ncbi:MAG: hypothetical protein PHY34_00490 [Patescibacteria group bacterium]|nr:hypothetical protein [Patescibacteria group bacterium]MDD5715893.1 hypothetical protein [Patescibacteria group bacterium]
MQNLSKTFFSRERIIGLTLYVVVSLALYLAKVVFSHSEIDIFAVAIGIMSGVMFFVAFFGLSSKNYKYHAQGALMAWGVHVVVSLGLIFFNE